MTPEEEIQLWARFMLQAMLLRIAHFLRDEAGDLKGQAKVMLAAAARLDIGR